MFAAREDAMCAALRISLDPPHCVWGLQSDARNAGSVASPVILQTSSKLCCNVIGLTNTDGHTASPTLQLIGRRSGAVRLMPMFVPG